MSATAVTWLLCTFTGEANLQHYNVISTSLKLHKLILWPLAGRGKKHKLIIDILSLYKVYMTNVSLHIQQT